MPRYLLTIYQPDGPPPGPEVMSKIGADLHALNTDLRVAGSWVFTGGLLPPETAKVLRPDRMVTDGPYLEGKEHIGGIWVIDVPDPDAAVEWARRASAATTLPIEVRPFRDVEPY